MRRALLVSLVFLPATAAFVLCAVMLVTDYAALVEATAHFQHLAANPSTTPAAMIAAATGQDIHRINVFADGTWGLLSVIWFTLGLVAWPRGDAARQP